MAIEIRDVARADIPRCGEIMYEAFKSIAERHNFPPDFPDAEAATGVLTAAYDDPGFDGAVAEDGGRIHASIFVSRRSPVGGISALTVDPSVQDRGIGKRLMQHGMDHLEKQGFPRQQLVQAAYHNRSLCLYTKLGFNAVEILSNMTGGPVKADIPGRAVRPAATGDAAACNALCRKVHGYDRAGEVNTAIAQGTAKVVEADDGITGYATDIGFTGHGVGESNEDLKALIAAADSFSGPGLLLPSGNGELFRWCLENGLTVSQQLILMDTHPAGPPSGVYWPSVLC